MRIDLLFPALPPALDGIGDYTAYLAKALVPHGYVRILTAQRGAAPIAEVELLEAFQTTPLGFRSLKELTGATDWLILQYNPFSYGRYGFNPVLPEALSALKSAQPSLRIAVMVHEPFVPLSTWRFAIMTSWQRWQLWRLGHVTDLVFCAIEPWTRTLRPYVASGVPLVALPVGSNIPDAGFERQDARDRLSIEEGEFVVGVFGSARRLLGFIKTAVDRLTAEVHPLRVLYAGPDGAKLRAVLTDKPLLDLGPLPAEEVSRALRAMDVHLAPYPRGVSARRGAFIAGLQHGVPTISTLGDHTDPFIRLMKDSAFVLASEHDADEFAEAALGLAKDPVRCRRMAVAAREMHDRHFCWSRIAEQLIHVLQSTSSVQSLRHEAADRDVTLPERTSTVEEGL
jgi:glycosyltransferase involved in cell wall biosynthesis